MYILVIIVLLLVTAVFVLAEFAFYSSRKARLQAAADRGNRSAQIAIALIDNPNRYLSTTQIGITLVTIALGMYGEASLTEDLVRHVARVELLAKYAHPISTGITILLLTIVSLVVAEMVPKRLAQMYPEGLALLLARPTDWLSRFSSPLVLLLSTLTELILRLVPEPQRHELAAQEEVRAILASGAEDGIVHQAEQQLVENVFALGQQRVRTLMVPRVDIDYLQISDSLQRVRVALATSAHSHFPVCDGGMDTLIGVVHVKDLVKVGLISEEINLRALARKPMFVPESATALRVLEQFKSSATHIAFVLDEYGVLVGLITLNDLVGSMLGEITTVGLAVPPNPMIVKREDGSYLLDGMVSVAQLKELMQTDALPRDGGDFDTLGGFVMNYLGRIPATGDRFDFDRYQFEIMDMDRTRVDRVLLTIQPVDSPSSAP